MRTENRMLRFAFFVISSGILLLAACGRLPQTGGTSAPGAAQEGDGSLPTTAAHFPKVIKKDWVASVSKLCLQVDQTYTDVSGVSEPIAEEIKAALDRIGVDTTIGESADCQAHLKVVLEMTPYGESVGGAGTCYFDASAKGLATLSANDQKDLLQDLVRNFSPARGYGITFVYSCPSKAEADYAEAWGIAITPMLAEWWGAPGLVSALQSNNEDLARNAGYQLAQMGPEGAKAIPVLIEMLSDVNPVARESAAQALGQFGAAAKEAVPALIAAIDDTEPSVRHQAVYSLGYIGDEQAVPALMKVLTEGDDTLISAACSSLKAMKEKAAPAVPLLVEKVQSDEYMVASGALDALSAIGPAALEAVPTLIGLMEKGKESTISGWIVGNALEDITGQDFGEDAAAWRKWWEENK